MRCSASQEDEKQKPNTRRRSVHAHPLSRQLKRKPRLYWIGHPFCAVQAQRRSWMTIELVHIAQIACAVTQQRGNRIACRANRDNRCQAPREHFFELA